MCSKILSIVNAAALSFQQNYHLYSINLCIFNSKNSDHSVEVKKKKNHCYSWQKKGMAVDKILKGWYIINGILSIFGMGVDGMINKKIYCFNGRKNSILIKFAEWPNRQYCLNVSNTMTGKSLPSWMNDETN